MKSSLYNHIRILLISLFTLVANGAAWGQFITSYPEPKTSIAVWNEETKTATVSLTNIIRDDFNRTDLSFSKSFYVRWFVIAKGDNTYTPLTS